MQLRNEGNTLAFKKTGKAHKLDDSDRTSRYLAKTTRQTHDDPTDPTERQNVDSISSFRRMENMIRVNRGKNLSSL